MESNVIIHIFIDGETESHLGENLVAEVEIFHQDQEYRNDRLVWSSISVLKFKEP